MDKIRLGLIGCGGMAKAHAARFAGQFHRLALTACVDLQRERAEAVAKLLPGEVRVATDYREVLDAVDAVLLVLPHDLHHPVTLACLAAGKHVLVEKPMANSEAQCREMIAAAQRAKRVLMVAYCMRFHPLVLKLKELLDAKAYGRCFQLSIWTEQLTRYHEGHWALSSARLGGGQFFSHGCHYVDLMLWMMGRPVSGSHFGSNLCTPWMEKEGTSNVTLQFEGGAMGYHFGTWGARGSRLRYSFHAHCEEGMLEIRLRDGLLVLHSDAKKHQPGETDNKQTETILMESPHAKPTEAELAHFLDCIASGAQPLTDGASSLEGLQVIWKLYEAEAAGKLADLRGCGLGTLGQG